MSWLADVSSVRMAMGLLLLAPQLCQGAGTLTLAEALRLAHMANARLPVAALEASIAETKRDEARGRFGPSFTLGGALRFTVPGAAYASAVGPVGEERLQMLGRQPLYAGGALRAAARVAQEELRAAQAGYQASELDVDLEVRTRFSELERLQGELVARTQGLERLLTYLTSLRERRAGGEGINADVLRTQSRAVLEEADIADTHVRLGEARMELNQLLGRDVQEDFTVQPEQEPDSSLTPEDAITLSWNDTPDLQQADAQVAAAQAAIGVTKAARRPHLDLAVDTGLWGASQATGASTGFFPGLREDLGASAGLELSWSLWDFGVYEASLRQAQLTWRQAAARKVVTARQVRLEAARAAADLATLTRELEIRRRAVPVTRDAYLETEAAYRGGASTSLEVLDSYSSWVFAQVAQAQALYRLRVAGAQALRWGSP